MGICGHGTAEFVAAPPACARRAANGLQMLPYDEYTFIILHLSAFVNRIFQFFTPFGIIFLRGAKTVPVFADPALGEYSLAELVNLVRCQLRLHATPQELQAVLTRGVRLQYNPVLKVIPRVVKNVIMLRSYPKSGVRPFTATFTNPGYFALPEPMARHVEHMEVVLGQSYTPRVNCASISYGDIMEITFAGTVKETDVERDFFRTLVQDGLHVKVTSNRRE